MIYDEPRQLVGGRRDRLDHPEGSTSVQLYLGWRVRSE
jgi:hypothetical protein